MKPLFRAGDSSGFMWHWHAILCQRARLLHVQWQLLQMRKLRCLWDV